MRPRHAARARVVRSGIQGCHPGNDEPLPCSPCSCTRGYMVPSASFTHVRPSCRLRGIEPPSPAQGSAELQLSASSRQPVVTAQLCKRLRLSLSSSVV